MEAADCAFLGIIALLSSLWYVFRLGFYSDDWGLFGTFQLAADPSMAGLLRASFLDRPAQGVYSILLFRAFHFQPLGYHIVNALVIACMAVLLYLVLRRIQPSRAAAVAVTLIYVTMPNYSTDRFWFAAFAAPLSIVFYLLSLLADLDAAARRGWSLLVRRGAAVAALLVSVLLYETALPFFFLNPFLVWYTQKRRAPSFWSTFAAVNWLVLAAVAVFKAKTSPRLHAPRGMPALVWSIVTNLFRPGFRDGDYGLNLRSAFAVHFGDYFLRLPAVVWSLQQHHPSAWLPVAALAVGVAVFLYALSLPADFTVRRAMTLTCGGVGVFLTGYAMFLTNKAIQITPSGIGNRTSIAASLGVAFVIAGLIGWVAGALLRGRAQSRVFALMLGAYAAGGFFVISALSSFWIHAYATELAIASDVETHVASFPPRTTVLLGGICSYEGPAIVFESDWDLSGALRLHYQDHTLSADVLRPGAYAVTDSGIATILYEGEDDYDFSATLMVYDVRRHVLQPLPDRQTALNVLHGGRLDALCPEGGEGVGVRVF